MYYERLVQGRQHQQREQECLTDPCDKIKHWYRIVFGLLFERNLNKTADGHINQQKHVHTNLKIGCRIMTSH